MTEDLALIFNAVLDADLGLVTTTSFPSIDKDNPEVLERNL